MENKSYQLRYLPMFETDLLSTVNYIINVLKNEDAAIRLVDDIESAILKRLENPLAFEPYHSMKKREYPYYRIFWKQSERSKVQKKRIVKKNNSKK